MIYLDNNSTTRIDPAVLQAINECWSDGMVNPASQHQAGQRSRRTLEIARHSILEQLGAKTSGMDADRLLLTSGGTESNNLALFGLADLDRQILISAIEHPSLMAAAQHFASLRSAEGTNVDVRAVPVGSDGVLRLAALEKMLQEKPTGLVCVMAANNETGVIQPIPEVVALAHRHGALVHCDAVQWVGKYPSTFREWGVDSLSATCHKFHGPCGMGALVLRHGVSLRAQLFGGFQQESLRPGTEAVPLAVGFAKALEFTSAARTQEMARLRDRFEAGLSAKIPLLINGWGAPRMPHTSNFALPGIDRQAFLLAADFHGLYLSTGSACASGSSDPSPVLLAMGCEKSIVDSSLRASLGADTTESEIDRAIDIIVRIYDTLKAA